MKKHGTICVSLLLYALLFLWLFVGSFSTITVVCLFFEKAISNLQMVLLVAAIGIALPVFIYGIYAMHKTFKEYAKSLKEEMKQ